MTIAWGTHRSTRPDAPPRTAADSPVRLGRQLLIVLAAIAAYFGTRGATEAAYTDALSNARRLVSVERALGIYHEGAWQSWATQLPGLPTVMNWVYIWGHWPVIFGTLIWLALRHPRVYYVTRNAMILSGAIGLVIFLAFPVAPPRLADLGMVDTIMVSSESYRVLQPPMFTNQYAAMPSLHVGWDLLMGIAIAVAARGVLARAIAIGMPAAMTVAVLLTANHYLVDALIGAALTATCWWIVNRRWAASRRPATGLPGASGRTPTG
jgi:hypothetical protein